MIMMTYLLVFIARFLARCALGLIGARPALTLGKAPSCLYIFGRLDPGHLEARASRVHQHNKLLRPDTTTEELEP